MKLSKIAFLLILGLCLNLSATAEDGYRLWQRYDLLKDANRAATYRNQISAVVIPGKSPSITALTKELKMGLQGLLNKNISPVTQISAANSLLISTPQNSIDIPAALKSKLVALGSEGYLIQTTTIAGKKTTVITANTDIGLLYGTFQFLKLLQTNQDISTVATSSFPKLKHRILNHWDNLDRTVERGYAGFSLWDWHKLPGYIDKRYVDYARANASVGINGTVLTNVNANALILTPQYLEKVKALADAFRP